MNQLFKKLSLPAKLFLIGIIPLAFLVYFAFQIYKEKTEKIQILDGYLHRVDNVAELSNLISEVQSERRFSFGYAIKGGWRSELVTQRPRTDAALERVEKISDSSLISIRSYTFLDSLQKIRNKLDNNELSVTGVLNFFNNVIFRLNTLNVISSGRVSFLRPIIKELDGQKIMSEMVTQMGRLRSNIYAALYDHELSNNFIDASRSTYDIYKSYEKEFLIKAPGQYINRYLTVRDSSDLKQTMGFIDSIFNSNSVDTLYNAEKWWDISASAVDQMKVLQKDMLGEVQQGIRDIYEKERQARLVSLLFLILTIVVVITIVSFTISHISRTLTHLNSAAEKISRGAPSGKIEVQTKDVVGTLAQSILRIDENNRLLADAADAIGSGNFDVAVQPRSTEDILGNAVVRMKDDLQQFNRENEEKLWIHNGVEKINDSIRGEKDLTLLGKDALHAVAEYVHGSVGLIYVNKSGLLRFTAGYALADPKLVPSEFPFGETLVGQAAQKKKLMQLVNVPDDFIKIKTTAGEAPPKNILIVPLIHNEVVEGVLELASLETFSTADISFLNQVQGAIAIALAAAKSRARTQELLEETQAQSEELQAQQNELENINSELEAQAEKLQASEEELKVQQEELMQANQELEERSRLLEERNQLIVERNLEIQQKAGELELSTRYKSEFLANMSHELRTPLNSILLLSRLLSENNTKNLLPDQVEYAQVIQSSGQGLLSLIDEILDLSKIEAGKMDLDYHPVLIEEVTSDLRALFTPVAKERKLELIIEVDPAVPSQIETDKMRLEQVLKNLLSNALKFTAQGSVRLDVRALPENRSFISFSVKDTGIGIPADKQEHIFEAFQQADGSTRRKYGGTGLGLSISRELTKLLGGEMRLISEPDKGSEFTVYIPINKLSAEKTGPAPKTPEAVVEASPAESAVPRYRSENIPAALPDDRAAVNTEDKTILIIEDDVAFAKALLDFTHQKGYKGLIAVRGDEGIALAQQYKPLGILLDIQLPVKDGWEVMEELKSNPATRHIPVHIMSSHEVKKESLMKGAVDFINKPVAFEQMQEVFKKIEQVISKEHKKVLIVEENPKHAKALAYFLETFNVNAQISDSVKHSVQALQSEEVDCVILDMGIPDKQAYETLETVKKNPGLENLPIIIFTGKSLSKTEELRIRQYADSIVIKTAHSYQRILDEVSLFLHLMEEGKENGRQAKYKRLGALNEVLTNKKILIADDDVRNIFSLTKALELHNIQVFSAVDGKEALQQLSEHPDVDLVLMDIMMPEMDGYEAMQQIRQKPKYRNLPIIAVTAKAMTGDREKCIKAGASDYISKPVDIDQLLSLLRVWLYDKS